MTSAQASAEGSAAQPNPEPSAASSALEFAVPGPDGSVVPMASFQDKRVLLLTNVASQCGLTESNYKGLQELQERFSSRSFSVVAFPANDFGSQEPGSNDEIQAFASSKGATFPIMGKVAVKGDSKHPLWAWLESQPSQGFGLASVLPGPQWNFHKVLVVDGKVVQHYAPTTSPESIAGDIESALKSVE